MLVPAAAVVVTPLSTLPAHFHGMAPAPIPPALCLCCRVAQWHPMAAAVLMTHPLPPPPPLPPPAVAVVIMVAAQQGRSLVIVVGVCAVHDPGRDLLIQSRQDRDLGPSEAKPTEGEQRAMVLSLVPPITSQPISILMPQWHKMVVATTGVNAC